LSKIRNQPSRFEEQTDLQKKYTEIENDKEIKKRMIGAYGPRVAQFNSTISSYQKRRINNFYLPITEEKQIVLNSKLNSDMVTQIPESANHNFMELHKHYTKTYRRFLKN
jgi:hypothetical protein